MGLVTRYRRIAIGLLIVCAALLLFTPHYAATSALGGKTMDIVFLGDNGQEVRLTELLAQGPTLLYFWATWCKGCRKVQPAVSALAEKYKSKLQVIGINIGGLDSEEVIQKYRRRYRITYPLLRDRDNKALEAFRIFAIPSLILLDRNGQIRFRDKAPPATLEGLF